MKIRVMSDLHLEFGPLTLEPAGEDVLVLAGDIGIFTQGLEWADAQARRLGVPVVMIAGNHEFYQNQKTHGHSVASTLAALRASAELTEGRVTFLDCAAAEIAGIRFLGATLWTDFDLFGNPPRAMLSALTRMNDYRCIDRVEGERFLPHDSAAEHRGAVAFLAEEILAEPFAGPTVVVTHHAPSRRSIAERYASDETSPAYASNLETLVDVSGAALWVHGHIHHSFDYRIGGTRVLANPRGYYRHELNPEFDANLVIDLAGGQTAATEED